MVSATCSHPLGPQQRVWEASLSDAHAARRIQDQLLD